MNKLFTCFAMICAAFIHPGYSAAASTTTIDDTYLSALATSPYNKLRIADGSYTTTLPVDAVLSSDYKRDVLNNLVETAISRLENNPENTAKNVLIIGGGSGIMTGNIAHFLHQKSEEPNAYYGDIKVHAIDDYRSRAAQTVRGGTVSIPERSSFGDPSPSATAQTPKTEFLQMLSNLVRKENEESLDPDTLLSRIVIGRKTNEIEAEYTKTDQDLIADPAADDFFSAGVTAENTSTLEDLITQLNGSNSYGVILIDTDPSNATEMYDVLRAAFNALAPFGTIIIDDVSWTFNEQGGAFHVEDGLVSFLNAFQATAINSSAYSGGGRDFSADDQADVHVYDGEDAGTSTLTQGANSAQTSDNLSILEFHNIWPNRVRWFGILRRDGTRSNNIDLSVNPFS